MLARQRSAITDDKICRLVDELAIVTDAVRRFEIEVRPRVDTSLTEVAVDRSVVPVPIEQPPKVAQILAEPFGRHCRVLPALPRRRLSRCEGRCPEARLSDGPHHAHVGGIGEYLRSAAPAREPRLYLSRTRLGIACGFAVELHQQPRMA